MALGNNTSKGSEGSTGGSIASIIGSIIGKEEEEEEKEEGDGEGANEQAICEFVLPPPPEQRGGVEVLGQPQNRLLREPLVRLPKTETLDLTGEEGEDAGVGDAGENGDSNSSGGIKKEKKKKKRIYSRLEKMLYQRKWRYNKKIQRGYTHVVGVAVLKTADERKQLFQVVYGKNKQIVDTTATTDTNATAVASSSTTGSTGGAVSSTSTSITQPGQANQLHKLPYNSQVGQVGRVGTLGEFGFRGHNLLPAVSDFYEMEEMAENNDKNDNSGNSGGSNSSGGQSSQSISVLENNINPITTLNPLENPKANRFSEGFPQKGQAEPHIRDADVRQMGQEEFTQYVFK